MSLFEAIVLGIVQGLTEFLPISSSGHLAIVPQLFGWGDPGASFTAVIQLGTMAAVVIFFWGDLWRIASAWLASLRHKQRRSELDARMGWYLILATIPISVFGILFEDSIKTSARDLRVIGTMLIVAGFVLLAADRFGRMTRKFEDVGTTDAGVIGLAQSAALIPGVSRSGATITAGLFLGLDREAAARFSFLLSIPAVVLSGLFELKDIGEGGGPGVAATAVATVVSFAVGYASIVWLLRWLTRHSLAIFVAYRFVLGAAILILVATGTLAAHTPS